MHPNLSGKNYKALRDLYSIDSRCLTIIRPEDPVSTYDLLDAAEVVVTLIIALISAALAVFRILKIRRKNRIDEFYSAAMEIRNSIRASSKSEERTAAADKMRELQNTAFEQLVDEKLAADESFRIFITLSNDILDQIGNK